MTRRCSIIALCVAVAAGCATGQREELPAPMYPLSRTREEAFRGRPPRAGTRAPWVAPTVEQWRASSGLRVLFAQRAGSGVVSLGYVSTRAGRADSLSDAGTAQLTATLLPLGTRSHPGHTHSLELRSLGARLAVDCGAHSVELWLTVESTRVQRAAGLLAEAVIEPEFAERSYFDALQLQSEERRASVLSTSIVGRTSALRVLFSAQSAFAVSPTGTLEQIAARSRAQVLRFHRERFTPGRGAVVIAGDLSRAQAEAAIEQAFGGWRVDEVAIAPAFVQTQLPLMPVPWRVYENSGSSMAYLYFAWRIPALADDDFMAGLAMQSIFSAGANARLNRSVRETLGYTYSPGSWWGIDRTHGYMMVSMAVEASQASLAIAQTMRDVEQARAAPPRAWEVRAAQERLRNEFLARFETVEGVRDALASMVVHEQGPESWTRHVAMIDALSRSSIHQAFQRYLGVNSMAVVLVADRSRVARDLLATSPHGALLEEESP